MAVSLTATPFQVIHCRSGNVYHADAAGAVSVQSIDIEDVMAQGGVLPTGGDSGAITSSAGHTTLTTLGDDIELDLVTGGSNGAWLFSADADSGDSSPAGVGTGNAPDGQSGEAAIYTGDAAGDTRDSGLIGISTGASTTGTSGNIGLKTGDAAAGNSGDIALTTGSAGSTRGNIILDAPSVLFPGAAGALLTAQTGAVYVNTAGQTGSTASQWAGIGSGDSVDGNGGGAEIYTGNTTGSGTTGEVDLHSGDAHGTGNTGGVHLYSGNADAGNSGNISLQTGGATGTRGNIVLDGPMLKAGSAQWYGDVGFDIEVNNVDSTGDAATEAKGVYLQGGICNILGTGGPMWCQAGDGGSTGGAGGLAGIQAGQSTFAGATGGECHIVGGQAGVADANGGAVRIISGQGLGTGSSGDIDIHTGPVDTGTKGNVIFSGLPTSDPHVVGAAWVDAAAGHALKISQG